MINLLTRPTAAVYQQRPIGLQWIKDHTKTCLSALAALVSIAAVYKSRVWEQEANVQNPIYHDREKLVLSQLGGEALKFSDDSTLSRALVLSAIEDPNGAFSDPINTLQSLSELRDVKFKVVAGLPEICDEIKRASLGGKNLDVVYLQGHGSQEFIFFSKLFDRAHAQVHINLLVNPYVKRELRDCFSHVNSTGTIVLDSCNTGKITREIPRPVAKQLADIIDRRALAPAFPPTGTLREATQGSQGSGVGSWIEQETPLKVAALNEELVNQCTKPLDKEALSSDQIEAMRKRRFLSTGCLEKARSFYREFLPPKRTL